MSLRLIEKLAKQAQEVMGKENPTEDEIYTLTTEIQKQLRISPEKARSYLQEMSSLQRNLDPPSYPAELNPDIYSLDISVYKNLLSVTKLSLLLNEENKGAAEEHAFRLTVLFGNEKNAIEYLKKNENEGILVHDAASFALPLPSETAGVWSQKTWQSLAKRHLGNPNFKKRFMDAFKNAPQIESLLMKDKIRFLAQSDEEFHRLLPAGEKGTKELKLRIAELSKDPKQINQVNILTRTLLKLENKIINDEVKTIDPGDKKKINALTTKSKENYKAIKKLESFHSVDGEISIDRLNELTLRLDYRNAEKNMEAAKVFKSYNISEALFDQYLEWTPVDNSALIPDLFVDGAEVGFEGYYLKKLKSNDPRAPLLGEITACCQSIGKEGESSAKHGITSEDGGFYVICKGNAKKQKDTDPIISECWVWRSKEGNLVFDSVETQRNILAVPSIKKGINKLFARAAYNLVKEGKTNIVSLGTAGFTPKELGFHWLEQDETLPYNIYKDSDRQKTLAINNELILSEIYLGMTQEVKDYISKNPGIITSKADYLASACLSGNMDMVELIFAEINKIDDDKMKSEILNSDSPNLMTAAVLSQNIEIVKFLIKNGLKSMNQLDKSGDSPLITAIRKGDDSLAEVLIAGGADVNIMESSQSTPLSIAVALNNLKLIKILIDKGANVNAPDSDGQTPLMIAASQGCVDIVLLLLEKGAFIPLEDLSGKTAFQLAVDKGHHKIAKLLSGYSLINDAQHGMIEKVKSWLGDGVNINFQNHNGQSALMLAIFRKQTEIVNYLIENKADVNMTDRNGNFPAIWAAGTGQWAVVEKLVANGADINKTDSKGRLVLLWAASSGQWNVVQNLITLGADINIPDGNGHTVLLEAANQGKWDLVKILVENYHADISPGNPQFEKLAHLIRTSKNDEMINWIQDKSSLSQDLSPEPIISDYNRRETRHPLKDVVSRVSPSSAKERLHTEGEGADKNFRRDIPS